MVSDNKEPLPLALSGDSKRNAFYHRCHVHGQERSYAACVARIEGRLFDSIECSDAIKKTDCPAQILRDKELTAGHTIYFVERSLVQEFIGKVKSWVMPTLDTRASNNKSLIDSLNADDGNVYAELINKPVKKLELLPGESPLEAIRRRKREK
jgi:hypothetical protein